ncbi:hypothetical protein FA95DRAFT_166289 [Auriscalpium vulgare]|uniref:Uncharacterized protein n=1 Tax=Auriscalpium vulgare TaxID=40419 RepID=A0ACB8RN71_9AGAM|nr:hypothetical protein FA95DRAFT_166289 [Auriscalpium vulgare]
MRMLSPPQTTDEPHLHARVSTVCAGPEGKLLADGVRELHPTTLLPLPNSLAATSAACLFLGWAVMDGDFYVAACVKRPLTRRARSEAVFRNSLRGCSDILHRAFIVPSSLLSYLINDSVLCMCPLALRFFISHRRVSGSAS